MRSLSKTLMATSTREETWTACLTFPKVPSPNVRPISYCADLAFWRPSPSMRLSVFVYRTSAALSALAAGAARGGACGATAAETDALAGGSQRLRGASNWAFVHASGEL